MIKKIKDHIIVNYQKYLLGVLLVSSLVLRIWYSSRDNLLWWDTSVYLGMGKYLATLGHYGFWEFFRPPLLPIFYGILYKLNLSALFFGKALVVGSSVSLIYLVYKLAEKIKSGAGLWAGLFLSITPVFFYFSKVPLSDITSAFIATLALYFFIVRKDFISGLFVGIAFLTRFPQGLILLPILISILFREYDLTPNYFRRVFVVGLKIVAGFSILVVPYLISNYFLYGNALLPITTGNSIVGVYNFLYFKGVWFYVKELWVTAPFLFLSLLAFVPLILLFNRNTTKNNTLISIFITYLIFLVYFFLQPHKELRYSIAFLPYVAVLAGVGAVWIVNVTKFKNIFRIIFILGIVFFIYKVKNYILYVEVDPNKELYSFLENKTGVYISTSPMPGAIGNILIPEVFENYNSTTGLPDLLQRRYDSIDGVIVNSCDVYCDAKASGGSCKEEIEKINQRLENDFKETFNSINGECIQNVYEKIK